MVVVAIVGYFVICLCMLVSIVLDDNFKMFSVLLLVVGTILNIATGVLFIIRYNEYKSYMTFTNLVVIGSLQLVVAVVMAVDVFFMLKK